MTDSVLEVKNLIKRFGKFTAVNDISFSLQKGEVLGLLGPNGAGKTTTIQVLLGVINKTMGSIKYFEKDFNKNREEILKKINFSSTYISLPWYFTVLEILELFARLYEISDRKKRIKKLIHEFELDELINKGYHKLSSGEKTRLLLAKAFLNYPNLILLDEPTASLDVDIAVKIREFLKKQQKNYGVSILLTSHNMSEVEELCNNVIILDKGNVIARDTPENLAKTISKSKVELLIKKDHQKALSFFKKINIPFVEEKFKFKIQIDEHKIAETLILIAQEKIEYDEISIEKPSLEDFFLKTVRK